MCFGTCCGHASGIVQKADQMPQQSEANSNNCSLTRENLIVIAAELDHQQLLLGCKAPSGMLSPVLQTPMQEHVSRQALLIPACYHNWISGGHLC